MPRPLDRFTSTVARRPGAALAGIVVLTLALAAGTTILPDPAGDEVFLPPDSEVAQAREVMADAFPDSAGLIAATIVFRGDVVTPRASGRSTTSSPPPWPIRRSPSVSP